jgi:hypothetical protein
MNSHHDYNKDLLMEHINPEQIERAPSGFTEMVMTRVNLEAKPVRARAKFFTLKIVPLVSVAVTLILTVIVLLLPAAGNEPAAMPWMKVVRHVNLPALHLNLDTLFSFSLPAYLPYLFICLLVLTIFDRGLNGLFHRGK